MLLNSDETIKISLVITTYNRYDTFLQFNLPKYLLNPYLNEIIIYDDCSDDYTKILLNFSDYIESGKIKLYKQPSNIGALKNKIHACTKATNEWICLMDSDNFCDTSYFDALFYFWKNTYYCTNTIYNPEDALPAFNYSLYNKTIINKSNWNNILDECLKNNGNYILHKSIIKHVLPILDEQIDTYAIDVKYMNYYWIKNGISLQVVPNMKYDHVHHPGNFYRNTAQLSQVFNDSYDWKI